MATVHISEQEAIRDFAAVLQRLDAGDAVTIDREGKAGAVALMPQRAAAAPTVKDREDEFSSEVEPEFLSEFRERHSDPLDRSRWD